ncbi:hypothetical protein [Streptomyces coelicoflavus]|uniref:hypothetical protein n=1 Tax=Streptomyces coelicoflavus TaxID=285562 RepID=UPI0036813CB8
MAHVPAADPPLRRAREGRTERARQVLRTTAEAVDTAKPIQRVSNHMPFTTPSPTR